MESKNALNSSASAHFALRVIGKIDRVEEQSSNDSIDHRNRSLFDRLPKVATHFVPCHFSSSIALLAPQTERENESK